MKKASKVLFNFAGATGIISLILSSGLITFLFLLFFGSIIGLVFAILGAAFPWIGVCVVVALISIHWIVIAFASQLSFFIGTIASFIGSIKKLFAKIVGAVASPTGLLISLAFVGIAILALAGILALPLFNLVFGDGYSLRVVVQTPCDYYDYYSYYGDCTHVVYLSPFASPSFTYFIFVVSVLFVIASSIGLTAIICTTGGFIFFILCLLGTITGFIELKKEKKKLLEQQNKEEVL